MNSERLNRLERVIEGELIDRGLPRAVPPERLTKVVDCARSLMQAADVAEHGLAETMRLLGLVPEGLLPDLRPKIQLLLDNCRAALDAITDAKPDVRNVSPSLADLFDVTREDFVTYERQLDSLVKQAGGVG